MCRIVSWIWNKREVRIYSSYKLDLNEKCFNWGGRTRKLKRVAHQGHKFQEIEEHASLLVLYWCKLLIVCKDCDNSPRVQSLKYWTLSVVTNDLSISEEIFILLFWTKSRQWGIYKYMPQSILTHSRIIKAYTLLFLYLNKAERTIFDIPHATYLQRWLRRAWRTKSSILMQIFPWNCWCWNDFTGNWYQASAYWNFEGLQPKRCWDLGHVAFYLKHLTE